jgi:DNA-binding NtrC family response regulator
MSPSPRSRSKNQRLILFVTRDDSVGDLYVAALTAHGRRARRVRDCASAEAWLGTVEDIAAIFVDVLDEPDWPDCSTLARVAAEQTTPLIVVTGWLSPDRRFRRRAFAAGCAAFVAKPCSTTTLLTTLDRVVAGERHVEVVAHRRLA